MKPSIALLASAFFALGMSANAQTGRSFGNGTLPEFRKPYDSNNDGVLSTEEMQAACKGRIDRIEDALAKWDTDGDGKLSPTEIEAARKAIRDEIDAIRKQRFTEADKDSDGFLSLAEFTASIPVPPMGAPVLDAATVLRMFNYLDTDKDGKISLAEFLAACPQPPRPPELPMMLPHFSTVDTDADKIISPEEFSVFIKSRMPSLTADQIAAMFAVLDKNRDNGITSDEWPVRDGGTCQPPAPLPLPAFASADKNVDGAVDPIEFSKAACASHIPVCYVPDMFRRADANRDGKLNATEYASIPSSLPTAIGR